MQRLAVPDEQLDISVIVITYNRSSLLAQIVGRLVETFNAMQMSYEMIVADDASIEPHRSVIDRLPDITVARTASNSGLGANANNGFMQSKGRYILQIQDDWQLNCSPTLLEAAFDFLEHNSDIGILQLTPVGTDLPVENRFLNGLTFRVFQNDQLPWVRRSGLRPYSDNPHLKRRAFCEDLGPYAEGVPMTICENYFKKRVARQRRWKVAMIVDKPCFNHLGEYVSFNPGGRTHPLVRAIHSLPYGKTHVAPLFRSFAYSCEHVAALLRQKWR